MAKSNYMTTIAIDTNRSAIHFYSMVGNDKSSITHNIKSYAGVKLDENFFDKFKDAVKDFAANTPSESIRKVTVILPDSAVLTDTVRIPTVKGSAQTQKMLDTTLGGLYRNYKDLHIIAQMADQNKQYSTIGIAAVQNSIVSSIYSACSENKLLVDTLSFASASSVAAATLFNPKLKNASYVFLDVKDVYSRFVFVVGGKVMGFYTLPFGVEFLRNPKVVREDALFDHSYAELTVLNARERAKSKKLTVMGSDSYQEAWDQYSDNRDDLSENYDPEGDEEDAPEEVVPEKEGHNLKIFSRKSQRNLPKFMLREIPETKDGIAYENFRVFMKWALTLIHSNEKITEIDKPRFVCVNLPEDLSFVVDVANKESSENGITFTHLNGVADLPIVCKNLELYGGLFPSQINSANRF